MPINNDSLVIPGEGHFYFDPTGTATKPADPRAPGATLPEVGHTTRESPLTITREGGERTTHATWQNSAARESVAPINYRLQFTPLQWDELTYSLYFGQGNTIDADYFGVPKSTAVPTQGRLYIRVDDGNAFADFWLPLVSILGEGNVELDPENLSGFPLGAAVLGHSDFDNLFEIGRKREANTTP